MFYVIAKLSPKVVTVSSFSKKDIVKFYKINPDKIKIIYEGTPRMPEVEEKFIKKTLAKFKIDRPYFLYIGNWRPRKNLEGLISAFKIFRKKTGLNWLLVIGGIKDQRFLNLKKEALDNQLGEEVILTDTLSHEEVSVLYKKAEALTFPSFYEGFGLPLLEAQSLGIPVLTSDTSSMPEVAGNAALYVNPYNIEDIAQGMEKLAKDKTLRQNLIREGFENIKRFSWEKSAQQFLDLFHSL
jgi:glycosyltransferase involved in cell wall biosynthesis